MINLAGCKSSDSYIENELKRCGINIIKCEKSSGEVGYSIHGKLDHVTFNRAWRYYIVKGKIPLEVANKLYENEIGKSDIRVNGHCGCPPPLEQAIYEDAEGNILISKEEMDEINLWIKKRPDYKFENNYKNIDEVPIDLRKGYIELYHIDSELGLYVFTEILKKEGVVKVDNSKFN